MSDPESSETVNKCPVVKDAEMEPSVDEPVEANGEEEKMDTSGEGSSTKTSNEDPDKSLEESSSKNPEDPSKSPKSNGVKIETEDDQVEDEDVSNEEADDEEIEDEEQEDTKPAEPKAKIITHVSPRVLYQEPIFAELCSFFNTFGSSLGLKYSIERLEKLLCTHVNGKGITPFKPIVLVDPELIDLHLFLMRRVRINWARADKFDMCLERYCEICPALDSEELELKRFDYVDLPMNAKLTILKALCESQFDFNYKFKEMIFHTFSHAELRLTPIGYDRNGCAFYYQQDFELSLRVYSFELDDQSGASWTMRARSSKELYKLIQTLKSSDYGQKKESDSEEEELDETKIVEGTVKQELLDEESKDPHDADELIVELSDSDREKIQMLTKKSTLWDMFQGEDQLNKKQKQKEERRKTKEAEKTGTETPQKPSKKVEEVEDANESEKEEEEEDLSEFMDDRRILPRRSARSTAITNLKQFTSQTRKRNPAEPKKTTEKQESEAEASEESDPFEGSDEVDDEDELGSSDDEFVGPKSSKKGKGRKRKSGTKPKKPKTTPAIPRKRAPKPVAFDEESSSDEDTEEVKQKERKKANEKTLCMKCRGSKRPDVLLLCDMCDDAWHIFCLRPVLHFVPDGDWFCPKCHHQMLIQKLSYAFIEHQQLLKAKEEEERKRALEIERLNRERKHNGIDLKNIIFNQPTQQQAYDSADDQSSEEEEVDDGQRKSKRRALKKVLTRTRQEPRHQRDLWTGPVLTIAEGRSRRNLNKVDYNFQAYDDQLQEAMDAIDSPPANGPNERPSGLGRGKDMATILEAEERRGSIDEEDVPENEEGIEENEKNDEDNAEPSQDTNADNGNSSEVQKSPEKARKQGKSPIKKKKTKKTKRLTDLDLDNATESDTDEYRASSDEEAQVKEDEEVSSDEYLPSDEERRRRSGRNGRVNQRTQSDEEFIDDDDSDSDFAPKKRKGNAAVKRKDGKQRGGRKSKRGRKWSYSEDETEEESDEEYKSESSEDDKPRRQVGKKPTNPSTSKQPARKWAPKEASSSENEEESEEVEMEEESDASDIPTTQAGRPLRRAATEMKKKMEELEKQGAEIDHEVEDEDEGNTDTKVVPDVAKIVGQPRKRTAKIQDDDEEDEFQPDEAESNSAEESADEQIEEELAKKLAEKKQRQKRQIQSDESDEEEVEEEKPTRPTSSKPAAKVTPQRQTSTRRSPQKQGGSNGIVVVKPPVTLKRQDTQESQRVSTPEDPTPPVQPKRGGRRKSDVPPAPKSPAKSAKRSRPTPAQQTPRTTGHPISSTPSSLSRIPHSSQQPLQQLEQMRPPAHHPHPMAANVTYIAPSHSVAYALSPHIRPMPGVHYMQPPPHVIQQGYEYYGAPPPQYIHGHPAPPTTHVYHPPPAHLIGGPSNSYQVYAMPYDHAADQHQVTQLQPMRAVDPDSLGHALAGAMNPDAL